MDALRLLSRSTGLKSRVSNASLHNKSPAEDGASHEITAARGNKRKHDEDLPMSSGGSAKENSNSEQEIRQIQKQHSIKIVDLNAFRKAHNSSESRKSMKETSRIFPQPLTAFSQLRSRHSINASLARNISSQGYHDPTEVQIATLPLLLSDSETAPNLLTVAPTGSGKTLAFLIPLIEKISQTRRDQNSDLERHVGAIILAPTKELVSQIVNEGRKLSANTGVTITAMRKGMQLREGKAGGHDTSSDSEDDLIDSERDADQSSPIVKSDILVATPLSVVHQLCSDWEEDDASPPQPMPHIESLVLDEADVLLDPLFRAQTLAIWSACISQTLRVSMWSATIGSNIEELAVQTIASRQKRLKLSKAHRFPLLRTIVGLKDISLPTIAHRLTYTATESGKLLGMRHLLHPSRSVPSSNSKEPRNEPLRPPLLVFTQTIARAQSLYDELRYDISSEAGGSSRIAVLHSSLREHARASIMQNFRLGKIWVLITTDLLSRGVDFRGVNVVVNYDIPTTVAGYVHRAGRTGRAGREGGVCVSFYTKEDVQYVKGIANVIAASEKARDLKAQTTPSIANGSDGSNSRPPPAVGSIQPWLLHALPTVSKSARKMLKLHGVESRRAIHADDDEETRKTKRKARIGTQSGFEKREVNRKRGAIKHAQLSRRQDSPREDKDQDWEGFG